MTELTNLSTKEMKKIRKNFQMLFQDVYSSLDTRMKISKIVTEPLDIHNIGTNKVIKDDNTEDLNQTRHNPSIIGI